jgi:hypothetical protein
MYFSGKIEENLWIAESFYAGQKMANKEKPPRERAKMS